MEIIGLLVGTVGFDAGETAASIAAVIGAMIPLSLYRLISC